MPTPFKNLGFLLMDLVVALIFGAIPVHADDASQHQQQLNGGYYLLHELAGDESQLPILLDLKHAPQNVVDFADQVSRTGKKTAGMIEDFHDRDHALQFERNPLPQFEQDVRDSIKGDKQHELLFGTKDAEFVRSLCIAQLEAGTYGLHLCKVLAGQETNPARAGKLRQLSAQWLAIREGARQILRNY